MMNCPYQEQGCRSTDKKDALFYLIFIFERGDTFISKYYNKSIIEINIALKFFVAAIPSSNGGIFRKFFKFYHSLSGFKNFKNPKQLVAYFGTDPSVNESGKFKGDKNKTSKRGSRIARRVLYTIALTIIRHIFISKQKRKLRIIVKT